MSKKRKRIDQAAKQTIERILSSLEGLEYSSSPQRGGKTTGGETPPGKMTPGIQPPDKKPPGETPPTSVLKHYAQLIVDSPLINSAKVALLYFLIMSEKPTFTITYKLLEDALGFDRKAISRIYKNLFTFGLASKRGTEGTIIDLRKLEEIMLGTVTWGGETPPGEMPSGKMSPGTEEEEEELLYIYSSSSSMPPGKTTPVIQPPSIVLLFIANEINVNKISSKLLKYLVGLYKKSPELVALVLRAARQASINLTGFIRKTLQDKRYEDLSIEEQQAALDILNAARRFETALNQGISSWIEKYGESQVRKDLMLLLSRPVLPNDLAQSAQELKTKVEKLLGKFR